MNREYQPIGDRVLVRRDATETETSSGIVIPDTAQTKPRGATVVAVNEGEEEIGVGDYVLTAAHCGTPIEINGETLELVLKSHVMLRVPRGTTASNDGHVREAWEHEDPPDE